MEHEKIERISELTRLSRERELTHEELVEREALRREYLEGFRQNMQAVLESVRLKRAGRQPGAAAKEEDKP